MKQPSKQDKQTYADQLATDTLTEYPDRHGNPWTDGGVYLVEVAWNANNPTHPAIVESRCVTPGGWGSYGLRENPEWEGKTHLTLFNPSYEGLKTRLDPDKVFFLRILRKLDIRFDFRGRQSLSPTMGKTPARMAEEARGDTNDS